MNRTLFTLALLSLTACASLSPREQQIQAIEKRIGGHIGVAAYDLERKQVISYRADQKFLMCSTFKLLLVAQVLQRIDQGQESLDRMLRFGKADLLEYAPVTGKQIKPGRMSVRDLSVATMQWSDNTAANLLLKTQGGPAGLTKFLRSLGDTTTRLDRIEPFLNDLNGDLDTTTPASMAATIEKLLFGEHLSVRSRELLRQWMLANKTGDRRLRAGIPAGWQIAEKTGTGKGGFVNDIGVILPPAGGGAPIVIAVYLSGSSLETAELEAAVAEIAKLNSLPSWQ